MSTKRNENIQIENTNRNQNKNSFHKYVFNIKYGHKIMTNIRVQSFNYQNQKIPDEIASFVSRGSPDM